MHFVHADRLARAALLVLGLALFTASALGQGVPLPPNPARLRYDRPKAFPSCPDEHYFRTFVAARLGGIDPFTDEAPHRIEVTLSRSARGFTAVLTMYDGAGKRMGGDELTDLNCLRLAEDAGRTVVTWLIPIVGPPGTAPPSPTPAPSSPPPTPPAPAPPAPAPPETLQAERATPPEPGAPSATPMAPEAAPEATPAPLPMRAPPEPKTGVAVRVGAGVLGERVATEQGSLGLTIDVGARYRWGSVALEAHANPPLGTTLVPGGSLSFTRITGALLTCAHFEWLVGCVKAEAGGIGFPVAPGPAPVKGYGAIGVRVGLDLPIAPPHLALRVAVEVLPTIDASFLAIHGQNVFQIAGTTLGLALGFVYELPRP